MKLGSIVQEYFEVVLIDDNEHVRMLWESIAKDENVSIITFYSTTEFLKHIKAISKEKTKIYIDSSLAKEDVRGEVFAEALHKLGYVNIFLASGHDSSEFAHLTWLKCIGKKCPLLKDR